MELQKTTVKPYGCRLIPTFVAVDTGWIATLDTFLPPTGKQKMRFFPVRPLMPWLPISMPDQLHWAENGSFSLISACPYAYIDIEDVGYDSLREPNFLRRFYHVGTCSNSSPRRRGTGINLRVRKL